MSFALKDALTKYFRRTNGKVVFCNNLTLNQLALLMWEKSSYCGVDSSVLSKVLNGKRLFTPQQLDIFCKVLCIERTERDYIFYCLHKDRCLGDRAMFDLPFVSSADTLQFVETLMGELDTLFQAGNWRSVYSLSSILEAYLSGHVQAVYAQNPECELVTNYNKVLYFYTKGAGSLATQDTIMSQTAELASRLRRYPNSKSIPFVAGHIASFMATAYRVRGLFPTPLNPTFNPGCTAMSKRYAAQALRLLPITDNEYLASLRNLLDAAISLKDKDTFLHYQKVALRTASLQPVENFLSTMQLSTTVGRGMALFKAGDPFTLKEKMQRYFGRTLAGTKVYELSDIKTELEIYLALQSKKNAYINQRISRGLTLASEESERYKGVILALAGKF